MAWDSDGSGAVDVAEMVGAVRGFGEGQSEEEAMEEAMEVVQQMDEDHDGKINWEEMKNYFTTLFEPFPTHVFDQVVTAMLAATKEKPYQGWVLDGFPSTPSQARALEYALTGYREVNEEAVRRRQTASLLTCLHTARKAS